MNVVNLTLRIYLNFVVLGGIHTSSSSQITIDKRHDSQEKLTDQQSPMASSSRGTGSEDNDSDFDNQSHEDDLENEEEQVIPKKAPEELINEQEELQKQLIVSMRDTFVSIVPFGVNLDSTTKNSLEYRTRMVKKREKLYRTIRTTRSSSK